MIHLLIVGAMTLTQFVHHDINQPNMFRNTNPILAANLQQRCDRLRENGFLVSNSGCSNSQPSRLAPQANSNTTPSDAPLLAVQPSEESRSDVPPSPSPILGVSSLAVPAAPAPTQDTLPSFLASPSAAPDPSDPSDSPDPTDPTRVPADAHEQDDTLPEPRGSDAQYQSATTTRKRKRNTDKSYFNRMLDLQEDCAERSITMDDERKKYMKEKEALCHEEALYFKEKREYLKRREEREIEELNLKKKELGERDTAPSTASASEPSDNNEQIVPV